MDKSSATHYAQIETAVETLAQTVLESEPLVQYQQAKAALEGDLGAKRLLSAFSSVQREMRQRQTRNLVTPESVDQLRSLQRQVQGNAVIMAYVQTQQEAVNYLREVNQEISQWIGVDFATLARRRSGCC